MFAFELGARGQMVGCVLGSEDKRLSGISKREESLFSPGRPLCASHVSSQPCIKPEGKTHLQRRTHQPELRLALSERHMWLFSFMYLTSTSHIHGPSLSIA
jgi:hypothetical protein